MGDDGLAVTDRLPLVEDVGELTARRGRGVENVFASERYLAQTQKSEDLQAVRIVVGDAEQLGDSNRG